MEFINLILSKKEIKNKTEDLLNTMSLDNLLTSGIDKFEIIKKQEVFPEKELLQIITENFIKKFNETFTKIYLETSFPEEDFVFFIIYEGEKIGTINLKSKIFDLENNQNEFHDDYIRDFYKIREEIKEIEDKIKDLNYQVTKCKLIPSINTLEEIIYLSEKTKLKFKDLYEDILNREEAYKKSNEYSQKLKDIEEVKLYILLTDNNYTLD